jgi:hypothetical protein
MPVIRLLGKVQGVCMSAERKSEAAVDHTLPS